MNNYNNKIINNLEWFVRKANEIENNSSPTAAKIKQFFLGIENLIFGDHHWYSYHSAFTVVQHYIDHQTDGIAREIKDLVEEIYLEIPNRIFAEYKLSPEKQQEGSEKLRANKKQTSQENRPLDKTEVAFNEDLTYVTEKSQDPKHLTYQLPNLLPDKIPLVSARLLFQMQAGEFGKNSKLEGSSQKEPLAFVYRYIKQCKEQSFHASDQEEEIIRELEIANNILNAPSISQAVSKALKEAFNHKTSLLIPGGWVGLPFGHSMYYEIIPEEGGNTAALRIFNTGGGIQQHARFQVGMQEKVGYAEWKGIAKEKLLDPYFAKSLEEMITREYVPGEEKRETRYSFLNIYQGLKEFLEVKEESSFNEDLIYQTSAMKPQQAGTCAYHSLLAFIKSKMNDQEYRHFKCDIRIQSLVSNLFFTKSQEHIHGISEKGHWRLVEKSFKQISRKVNTLYQQKLVGSTYLQQVHKVLKPVEEWIQEGKKKHFEKEAIDMTSSNLKVMHPTIPSLIEEKSVSKASTFVTTGSPKQTTIPEGATKYSYLMQSLSHFSLNNPNTFGKELKEVRALLEKANNQKEHITINHGVIELIKKLEIKEEFFKQVSGTQAEKESMIADLAEIGNLFFNSCFKIHPCAIFPEKIYVLAKLNYIQMNIANTFHPIFGSWMSYPDNFHNLFLQIYDNKMVSEFNTVSQTNPLFPLSIRASDQNIFEFIKRAGYIEAPLERFLETHYPKMINTIKKNEPFYQTLDHERRFAHLYMHRDLPNWLAHLRDTELRMEYLLRATVLPPSNEKASLKIKMEAESLGEITVGLEGLEKPPLPMENVKISQTHRGMLTKNMKDCLKSIRYLERDYRRRNKEKDLAVMKMIEHIPGMSQESAKEIVHIFTEDYNILVEGFEYFRKYPEKIEDPDYQELFQIILFSYRSFHSGNQHSRVSEGITHQEMSGLIIDFFNKQLDFFINQNAIPSAIFLIRMSRYFMHICDVKEQLMHGKETLRKLLQRPGLEPEEKSMIFAELMASIGEESACTDEDMNDLLVGSIWLNDHPISSNRKDPRSEWEAERAMHVHAKALESRIMPQGVLDQGWIHKIYQLAKGSPPPKTWKAQYKVGENPQFTSTEGHVYQPFLGRISKIDDEVFLPIEMRENRNFQNLFPNQLKATLISNHLYQFKDANGHTNQVKLINGKAVIEQERSGKWFRFFNETSETIFLGSNYLLEYYQQWHSMEEQGQIVLISPQTDQEIYQIISSNKQTQEYEIIRLSDGAILGQPALNFSHFELSSYTHEWYAKDGKLVEKELPRFHLSFTPSADRKGLECSAYPGWKLAADQTIASLGTCRYYLVLEDANKNKKVIFPDQKLKAPGEHEVLEAKLEREQRYFQKGKHFFDYMEFSVDKDGELQSKSRENNLFLVETLAAHQEYALAADYLRRYGEKLSAYSPQELQRLSNICEISKVTGDHSGEQMGIALYAAYLIDTNPVEFKGKTNLNKLYKQYLARFQNITALKLSKSEEIRLLKNLLAKKYSSQWFNRLRELDPNYASKILPVTKTSKKSILEPSRLEKNLLSLDPSLKGYQFLTGQEKKEVLLTQSGHLVKVHLYEYIEQAIQGTSAEKEWLHNASIFMRSDQSEEISALGTLLGEIIKDPSQFTMPNYRMTKTDSWHEQEIQKKELKEWWINTVKTAVKLYQPRAISHGPERVNVTPSNFRLEKENSVLPKVSFSFDCRLLPSLAKAIKAEEVIDTESVKEKTEEEVPPQHGLGDFLNDQKTKVSSKENPLEAQEWERLSQDHKAFQQQPAKPIYRLKASVAVVKEKLLSQKSTTEKEIQELEEKMLYLANKEPQEMIESIRHRVAKWGGWHKEIRCDHIFISFGQKNPQSLLSLNKRLSEQEIQQLYSMASRYLLLSSNLQQNNRCLEACEQLIELSKQPSPKEENELMQQLATEILTERVYNPSENPLYLVFEYYSEIVMRQDQVDKINDFLSGKEANPVMEMIMGSGKSKVLLPLLGLLRADGKTLSMLVVPTPLFENISNDVHSIFKRLSKSLRTLHFDRNSTFTIRSLEEIRDLLKETIENRECLIMTSKSIQSLLLKFIEYAGQTAQREEFQTSEMQLMQEVVYLLNTCGNPLIDEADTVLNVLHEVCFSMGNQSSLKKTEVLLIKELYELLYTDPNLKAIAQLESDAHPIKEAPPLTQTIYHDTLKRPLAQALIERLKNKKFDDLQLEQDLHDFFAKNKFPFFDSQEKQLLDYLLREKSKSSQNTVFFKSLPPLLQNLFALASEELSELLPHTLVLTSDENYGLDAEAFAIPFAAANTPNRGSYFANPYITMNYTFQIHSKKKFSEAIIQNQIQKIQSKALQEMEEKEIPLSKTEAWKQFCVLKGSLEIPLFQMNEKQLHALTEHLNSSLAYKQEAVAEVFLPQLKLFDSKLSCNPFGFAGLFQTLAGFTGTLWNANSLHRKLNPISAQGTDAKTLTLLWKMSQNRDNVILVKKGSPEAILNTMRKQGHTFDMITDAGGYFKEGGNLAIAKNLVLIFQKPVVFYNEKGEQTLTDGANERPLSEVNILEGNRITFLDQSHTTGADAAIRSVAENKRILPFLLGEKSESSSFLQIFETGKFKSVYDFGWKKFQTQLQKHSYSL